MANKEIQNRKKLQTCLRQLFQFDSADLDFGIYRIMNQKREEIERFIEHDLLDAVEEGLTQFQVAEREELEAQLAERRDQLGPEAFDDTGAVREEFRGIKIAQDYMALRQQLQCLDVAEETEARVFNDLWRFFSRYYDNGDFLTERRYSSRGAKYCVPYNGEEVLLHWANRDQYYVKTTERFTDYRFTAGPSTGSGQAYTVWFRLQRAEVPQDNVKGDKRYFVLRDADSLACDAETKTLTVHFEYRPITKEEEAHYLGIYNAQQTKSDRRKTLDRSVLCVALESEILDGLDDPDLKAHLAAVPEDKASSTLGRHLNRYTARHTMDYFVHKNLGKFLRRELDVFLKNEVLLVDDFIDDSSGEALQHAFTRARVVRQIARKIIKFLAQIEDFQKRLFEKKKFVVQTDYCITVDRVPKGFYPEILANQAQLDEWRRLYRMDEWGEELSWQGEFDEAFLQNHPYVMVDTAFFDDGFKARLLATFDDLDGATDGLLIHGENFQALNLLMGKYARQVKCIYIDPPYNTGSDEFVYKDNYQHSSWLTMMADRVDLACQVLRRDGVFFTSISDEEQAHLRLLMTTLFEVDSFLADVIWHARKSVSSDAIFSLSHHHTLVYCANRQAFEAVKQSFCLPADKEGFENPDNDPRGPWKADPFDAPNIRPNLTYPIENPNTGEVFWPPDGRCWRTTPEEYERLLADNRIVFGKTGTAKPQLKRFWSEAKERGRTPTTIWSDVDTTTRGTQQVQDLFGYKAFDNPKPVKLIVKMLELCNNGILALDFFAGSGTTAHAVMDLNREDGGDRKYILVEMGNYFDTVLKPRIQKVAFSANWKDGVPQDRDGQSHIFKYQRLESYEDALNNIRVRQPEGAQRRLLYDEFDDYQLHYMLDFETRDSPTLLAQDAFEKPFDYTLKIQRGHESPQDTVVDLVETFHYLIGLHVRRLERHEHQGRRYVVSRGEVRTERGIEKVVVVWRDTEGLDLEQEADWANEALLTEPVDRVYVNGPSFIDKAEPLEITFRTRLEGGPRGA